MQKNDPSIWMKFFTMQSATEFLHVTLIMYIGPSLWNNQDQSLKTSASLNPFKHNIKAIFKREIKKSHSYNNTTTNYLSKVSISLLIFVTLNSLLYF